MKERARGLKAEARHGSRAAQPDRDSDVLAKIAAMPQPDRAMATRRAREAGGELRRYTPGAQRAMLY